MARLADLLTEPEGRQALQSPTLDLRQRIPGMFSVIIPVFNGERLLARAIRSVLNQTYQNFEVIIVDDGSADDSLRVARNFAVRDSRIRVYAIENSGGPARPRNYGIARSRGEFIAFLDQDDWWLKDKLELQARKFRANDYAVVYSDCLFVDPSSPDHGLRISELPEVRRRYATAEGYLPEGQVQQHLIMGNFTAQVTVAVRADWIEKVGPMDESLVGVDCYEQLLRIALAGGGFGVVRRVLAVHERGALSRDQETACSHTLRFFRKYARQHQEYEAHWSLRIGEYENTLLREHVKGLRDSSRPIVRRLHSLGGILALLADPTDSAGARRKLTRRLMKRVGATRFTTRRSKSGPANTAGPSPVPATTQHSVALKPSTTSGTPLRLNLACGQTRIDGFVGVDVVKTEQTDVVVDLNQYPWPWDANTVEDVYCAHFVEHVADLGKFMEEVWRVCKPGAKVSIIHPYAKSSRAFQDPTHVRFIPEATWLYFNKDWREEQGLDHYPLRCDFEPVIVPFFNPPWHLKTDEARQFAMQHYWDVISDLHVTLIVRK